MVRIGQSVAKEAIAPSLQMCSHTEQVNTLTTDTGLERPFNRPRIVGKDSAYPQHLRALAECSPDAIFISHFESALFVDANACRLFGYSADELRKLTGRDLHDPKEGAVVDSISRELIANSKAHFPSVRLRCKDGSFFWAEFRSSLYQSGSCKFYVVFIRDISNQQAKHQQLETTQDAVRERESRLLQAAHIATVGKLASGVVHEVNNPAAILQMNLEILSRRLENLAASRAEIYPTNFGRPTADSSRTTQTLLEGAKENISESFLAVDRIAGTMRSLSSLTKSHLTTVVLVSLNEVVEEAISLLGGRLRQVAELKLNLGQPEYFVGQKERWLQLLVNLILNAQQAVTECPGPHTIVVSTGTEGDSCFLEVADSGPGVPEQLTHAIFQPFVTTRATTGAVGLGLSSCVEIARQHRATLTLLPSSPGVRFRVQIPSDTGLNLSSR